MVLTLIVLYLLYKNPDEMEDNADRIRVEG